MPLLLDYTGSCLPSVSCSICLGGPGSSSAFRTLDNNKLGVSTEVVHFMSAPFFNPHSNAVRFADKSTRAQKVKWLVEIT